MPGSYSHSDVHRNALCRLDAVGDHCEDREKSSNGARMEAGYSAHEQVSELERLILIEAW